MQDAVDPVHCSETKRKVTELCASSRDPGSDLLPTLAAKSNSHKQGSNGGILSSRLSLANSTRVIIKNNSHE